MTDDRLDEAPPADEEAVDSLTAVGSERPSTSREGRKSFLDRFAVEFGKVLGSAGHATRSGSGS
jgi:hypothetical protein